MRTDIAGLVVIALLGATAVLLFTPPEGSACVVLHSCTSWLWRGRGYVGLTTLAAAIWLIWRMRRRPG